MNKGYKEVQVLEDISKNSNVDIYPGVEIDIT